MPWVTEAKSRSAAIVAALTTPPSLEPAGITVSIVSPSRESEDPMRQIELRGRHAVGQHRFAIVDDDMFDELSVYRWKAKPNCSGSGVYAVRNVRREDGTHTTVRMHRAILGYDGPLDVDHRNHRTLDNRRRNLRIATRSVNITNATPVVAAGVCVGCKKRFVRPTKATVAHAVRYCSRACVKRAQRRRHPRQPRPPVIHRLSCAQCSSQFEGRSNSLYCSPSCKSRAKWQKWKEIGHPRVLTSAERSRQWRAARRPPGQRVPFDGVPTAGNAHRLASLVTG
jgi:hypothetical protein